MGRCAEPTSLPHPILHLSRCLGVRRTERPSQDTRYAAPEAESHSISRWPVARRLGRMELDPGHPTRLRTALASKGVPHEHGRTDTYVGCEATNSATSAQWAVSLAARI